MSLSVYPGIAGCWMLPLLLLFTSTSSVLGRQRRREDDRIAETQRLTARSALECHCECEKRRRVSLGKINL